MISRQNINPRGPAWWSIPRISQHRDGGKGPLAARLGFCHGLLVLTLLLAPAVPMSGETLLVHLPSAPVEASNRSAAAIDALANYLAARLPNRELELKIFRRWSDAQAYLAAQSSEVVLMLSDASSTQAQSHGLTPAYRFERDGRPTYQRLLVVRSDRPELEKLVDLQGKTLTLVETAGNADGVFLKTQVLEDGLDPSVWFSSIVSEVDDFAATASVLYGKTDAALVAEFNPLLSQHLGQDLRVVFESPELSLPLLSIREQAFDAAEREVLEQAFAELTTDSEGVLVLAGLGIESFQPVAGAAVGRTAASRVKTLTIANSGGFELELEAPPLPAPEELSFVVAVELPEIPLPVDRPENP